MPNVPATTPKSQASKPWTVNVPLEFFRYPLTDQERTVFQLLDIHARHNTCCFVGYKTLADLAGKSVRQVQRLIAELTEKGFIKPVHSKGDPSKRSSRLGVILLKRVNPGENKAAETPIEIADAERRLRERQPGQPIANYESQRLSNLSLEVIRRFHLLALEELNPTGITIPGDDLVNSRIQRLCRQRVTEIAYSLREHPAYGVHRTIDEFALLCINLLDDEFPDEEDEASQESFLWHCKVGWAIRAAILPPVQVEIWLDQTLEGVAQKSIKEPPKFYTKGIGDVMGIDLTQEYSMPVSYAGMKLSLDPDEDYD